MGAVYDDYASRLYGYCWFQLRNGDAAQLAFRDTMMCAEVHIRELRAPAKLGPWLYAFARIECRRRRPAGPVMPDIPVAHHDQEDVDLRLMAWQAVNALPPLSRELLDLRYRHELAEYDIALVTGLPTREVAELLVQARVLLEAALIAEVLAHEGPFACPERAAILHQRKPAPEGRRTPGRHSTTTDRHGLSIRRPDTPADQRTTPPGGSGAVDDLYDPLAGRSGGAESERETPADGSRAPGGSGDLDSPVRSGVAGGLRRRSGGRRGAGDGLGVVEDRQEVSGGLPGEIDDDQREMLVRHSLECPVCSRHLPDAVSPAKVYALLPQAEPSDELRARVMSCFTDPEMAGYRLFAAARVSAFGVQGFPRQHGAGRGYGRHRGPRRWPRAVTALFGALIAAVTASVVCGWVGEEASHENGGIFIGPPGAPIPLPSPTPSVPKAVAHPISATFPLGPHVPESVMAEAAPERPIPGPATGRLSVSPGHLTLGSHGTGTLLVHALGGEVTWHASPTGPIRLAAATGDLTAGATETVAVQALSHRPGTAAITFQPGGATVLVSWNTPPPKTPTPTTPPTTSPPPTTPPPPTTTPTPTATPTAPSTTPTPPPVPKPTPSNPPPPEPTAPNAPPRPSATHPSPSKPTMSSAPPRPPTNTPARPSAPNPATSNAQAATDPRR